MNANKRKAVEDRPRNWTRNRYIATAEPTTVMGGLTRVEKVDWEGGKLKIMGKGERRKISAKKRKKTSPFHGLAGPSGRMKEWKRKGASFFSFPGKGKSFSRFRGERGRPNRRSE